MSKGNDIQQQENRIVELERHLNDTLRYKEKIELEKSDVSRGLQMLKDNMRFLKKKGIVSLMDEYFKVSKAIESLSKDLATLEAQHHQLSSILESQKEMIEKHKETLNNMKTVEQQKIIKFERKSRG